MKRTLTVILSLLLIFLCSCQSTDVKSDKLSIVSVTFPGYSFSKEIAGDLADITLLLPLGSESHGYEPSPKDIIKIQNADLFIYGGGESENWVKEVLSSLDGNVKTIAMTELVPLLSPDGHDHEKDEHVWTSPKNAMVIGDKITEILTETDPENAQIFEQNNDIFQKSLKELDSEFSNLVASSPKKEIVVGDRFPFLYMAKEYGLEYYSAFPGCSDESEPSAAVIGELVEKIKQDDIKVVFYTEFSNQKIANTLCESTGATPKMLHSCHNLSKADFDAGVSYLDLMRRNLENLKEALS